MSKIELNIYPAFNGDSFLLKVNKTNILIDGGYVNTYNKFIKKDLITLKKQEETLSHVIVTHFDQDHISGIVKLLEENNSNKLIDISNVWHNSYRHIQTNKTINEVILDDDDQELLEEIKGGSYLKEVIEGEKKISGIQGSTLARLIQDGGYEWNKEFNGLAISINNKESVQIDDSIKLFLLSPDNEKLSKLEIAWRKELRINGFLNEPNNNTFFDDAFEFMTAKEKDIQRLKEKQISTQVPQVEKLLKEDFEEDTRSANGSSIAFILEFENKKLLFLGDSHPSLIEERIKLLYPDEKFPIEFDLIKISHHGSWGNISPLLLQLIDSKNYIFSTNGKHGHPDYETIAQIISRKANFTRRLYFNYPCETAIDFDEVNLKEKYNYNVIMNDGANTQKIVFE